MLNKHDAQATVRPPQPSTTSRPDESIEQWESRILCSIFRVTLDPKQKTDASHHQLIFLPQLRQELEDEEAPVVLTKERLDSAILEAASAIPSSRPVLDYLLPCWKRVIKALRGLRDHSGGKDAVLKEAKRLCMSNCVFAVEMPELYG